MRLWMEAAIFALHSSKIELVEEEEGDQQMKIDIQSSCMVWGGGLRKENKTFRASSSTLLLLNPINTNDYNELAPASTLN